MRGPSRAIAAAVAVFAMGCGREDPGDRLVGLVPVASAEVPLSRSPAIALVHPQMACVVDSFEVRIHCKDRTGDLEGVFGQEGEGPGEFLNPAYLQRGPSGTVRVFDLGLLRMSLFELTGVFRSATPLPTFFVPTASAGSTVFGLYDDASGRGPVPAEIDPETGAILWDRAGLNEVVDTECGRVVHGLPSPSGGYVYRACTRDLVWFAHRNAEDATVVQSPAYVEQFPDQRDIEAYRAFLARLASAATDRAVTPAPSDPHVEAYKETPKEWFLSSRTLAFDARNRLWVATTLYRNASSHFEVWTDARYAGMVQIRDRLLGYDLMDGTLAALVERVPGPEGIARRAIDWYDISALDFGRHPD